MNIATNTWPSFRGGTHSEPPPSLPDRPADRPTQSEPVRTSLEPLSTPSPPEVVATGSSGEQSDASRAGSGDRVPGALARTPEPEVVTGQAEWSRGFRLGQDGTRPLEGPQQVPLTTPTFDLAHHSTLLAATQDTYQLSSLAAELPRAEPRNDKSARYSFDPWSPPTQLPPNLSGPSLTSRASEGTYSPYGQSTSFSYTQEHIWSRTQQEQQLALRHRQQREQLQLTFDQEDERQHQEDRQRWSSVPPNQSRYAHAGNHQQQQQQQQVYPSSPRLSLPPGQQQQQSYASGSRSIPSVPDLHRNIPPSYHYLPSLPSPVEAQVSQFASLSHNDQPQQSYRTGRRTSIESGYEHQTKYYDHEGQLVGGEDSYGRTQSLYSDGSGADGSKTVRRGGSTSSQMNWPGTWQTTRVTSPAARSPPLSHPAVRPYPLPRQQGQGQGQGGPPLVSFPVATSLLPPPVASVGASLRTYLPRSPTKTLSPTLAQGETHRSGLPVAPDRSQWAMWCGNVPSDATHEEMWRFFTSMSAPADERDGRGAGVESIHLIGRSNCAFCNYTSEDHLLHAIQVSNGLLLRPGDPRCKPLVCRVRMHEDDVKSGVGAQRGGGLHKAYVIALGKDVKLGKSEGDSGSSETGSSGSTTSSMFARNFPKRYFILKSHDPLDLETAVKTGLWSTQSHNEAVLDQAYRTASEGVWIVFSANKSGEWFGYAKMTGPVFPLESERENKTWTHPSPSPEASGSGRASFSDQSGIESLRSPQDSPSTNMTSLGTTLGSELNLDTPRVPGGLPFPIEWCSTERLPFAKTRHIHNSFNSGREVKISRDGTEIELLAAEQLLKEFALFQSRPLTTRRPSRGGRSRAAVTPTSYPTSSGSFSKR